MQNLTNMQTKLMVLWLSNTKTRF